MNKRNRKEDKKNVHYRQKWNLKKIIIKLNVLQFYYSTEQTEYKITHNSNYVFWVYAFEQFYFSWWRWATCQKWIERDHMTWKNRKL